MQLFLLGIQKMRNLSKVQQLAILQACCLVTTFCLVMSGGLDQLFRGLKGFDIQEVPYEGSQYYYTSIFASGADKDLSGFGDMDQSGSGDDLATSDFDYYEENVEYELDIETDFYFDT